MMNCRNNLSENTTPPEGIKAIWEQYKIPISVSTVAVLAMILYGKFG
jgi:hypothetical protein